MLYIFIFFQLLMNDLIEMKLNKKASNICAYKSICMSQNCSYLLWEGLERFFLKLFRKSLLLEVIIMAAGIFIIVL